MRRASKSPHGASGSNNTPHENKISDTMHASSIAAEPFAGEVTHKERHQLIAEAAYYRAESNQFKSDPLRDWIEAESDITILLSGGK